MAPAPSSRSRMTRRWIAPSEIAAVGLRVRSCETCAYDRQDDDARHRGVGHRDLRAMQTRARTTPRAREPRARRRPSNGGELGIWLRVTSPSEILRADGCHGRGDVATRCSWRAYFAAALSAATCGAPGLESLAERESEPTPLTHQGIDTSQTPCADALPLQYVRSSVPGRPGCCPLPRRGNSSGGTAADRRGS